MSFALSVFLSKHRGFFLEYHLEYHLKTKNKRSAPPRITPAPLFIFICSGNVFCSLNIAYRPDGYMPLVQTGYDNMRSSNLGISHKERAIPWHTIYRMAETATLFAVPHESAHDWVQQSLRVFLTIWNQTNILQSNCSSWGAFLSDTLYVSSPSSWHTLQKIARGAFCKDLTRFFCL